MGDAPLKKKLKTCEFGEEDVCNLFQRYTAAQVLALLREVAQSPGVKIDWNDLVKNTATGITSARECQILWRHLAYRHPLPDKIDEHGDYPMDDDSDLEYELEPSPPVSTELAAEAANCVKVLAFGSLNESSMPNSSAVEGDMPNGHSSKASSEKPHPAPLLHGSNISLPVSVQKQPQAGGPSGEGLDGVGLTNSNIPPRKKRKPWSEEEDLELIAAVKKFGEGNWANIVKGDFKGDRTASQLSQRWAIIRKKQGSSSAVGGATSQLSEVQLATRRAIDMALKDSITGVGNGAAASNNHGNLNSSNGDVHADISTVPSQSSQPTTSASTRPAPSSTAMAKPQLQPPLKKVPAKASVSDPIQAAAVAAGARIASPSDAASLFKAAQSKNAVHIMGGGGPSLIKSSTTGNSPLPPNVHFIRTGLAANAPSSMAAGGQQTKGGSTPKPTVPSVSVSLLSKPKSAPSSSANEPQQKENKTSSNEAKVPVLDVKPESETQENSASSLPKCSPNAPDKGLDDGKQTVDAGSSQPAMSGDAIKTEGIEEENHADGEKPSMVQEKLSMVQVTSNPTPGGSNKDSSSFVNANGAEKAEASGEANKFAPKDQ